MIKDSNYDRTSPKNYSVMQLTAPVNTGHGTYGLDLADVRYLATSVAFITPTGSAYTEFHLALRKGKIPP